MERPAQYRSRPHPALGVAPGCASLISAGLAQQVARRVEVALVQPSAEHTAISQQRLADEAIGQSFLKHDGCQSGRGDSFSDRHGLDLRQFQAAVNTGQLGSDVTGVKIPKFVDRDVSAQAAMSDALNRCRLIITSYS